MYTNPSVSDLIASVQNFIDTVAAPNLEGHAQFQARVSSNVLATVLRELAQRPAAEDAEIERLQALLNTPDIDDADALNARLSAQISAGDMTHATPNLIAHLKKTAIAQLNIDQPRYSGLKTAMEAPK